ncbi:MAG: rhomboid family intramembrane serine protease [Tannerella sp.]|jgi:membrane associated rhomboid family serine protease|nr:rhomboid family intramembrane serine protease [Tannerella sp.]
MYDNLTDEKKELRLAVTYSILLAALPWIVHIVGNVCSLRLKQYGLRPLVPEGLPGILTMPFLHAGWGHLISNTPAMLLLVFGLFLFYRQGAWRILLCLYFLSGFLTWLMGRDAIHMGASGLVYALAAFHFVSGVIKKAPNQRAFALLVAFLYGGFVWAFFPTLYQGTSISWEGHLSGLLAGITFAFYFRDEGPEPPVYPLQEEENEEDMNVDVEDEMHFDDKK